MLHPYHEMEGETLIYRSICSPAVVYVHKIVIVTERQTLLQLKRVSSEWITRWLRSHFGGLPPSDEDPRESYLYGTVLRWSLPPNSDSLWLDEELCRGTGAEPRLHSAAVTHCCFSM